jgi:hypothetical protein
MQITVESCSSIDVNTLQSTIKRIIRREYPESTKEEALAHTTNELRKFSVDGQFFEYTNLKNYLGGFRWFFLCPKCKKKANKLFLPPLGSKKEHVYACKACHKLKNQSAIMGQNSMYKMVTRPLKRMKIIEDRVARGHLPAERIQELLNEYETLEAQLKDSPEFRLFSFKKKHNLLT